MNRIRQSNISMLVFSLIAIVMGLLMYRFPLKVISFVGYALAAILLVLAVRYLYEFKKNDETGGHYKYKIVVAIVLIAAAIAIIVENHMIQTFLIYAIAILIIVSALIKGESAYFLRKMEGRWIPLLVVAVLCLILGILVLQMPKNVGDNGGYSQVGERGIAVLGIIFAAAGLIDLIYTIAVTPAVNRYKKTLAQPADTESEK